MRVQGNPDDGIQPLDRSHPGHTDLIRARLDELVRHISKGKCDPTHPGKRAKAWWAKAYSHFLNMQVNGDWWKQHQPQQYAIIHPEGGEPLDYRELNVAYPSLPKHDINVGKVRAALTARITGATVSPEDVKHIKAYLASDERYFEWPLWSDLCRNYKALQRIASGKLDGHGTEFSGASDFDPSVEELAAQYNLSASTVAALLSGLYVLVREQPAVWSESNPVISFRAIGIERQRRPRRNTREQTKVAAAFHHGRSRDAVMRVMKKRTQSRA